MEIVFLISVIVSLILTWTILRHMHYAEHFCKFDSQQREFIERINIFQRVKFSILEILGLLILSIVPVINIIYFVVAIIIIHNARPKSYSQKEK